MRPGNSQQAVSSGIALRKDHPHGTFLPDRDHKLLALRTQIIGQLSLDVPFKVQAIDELPCRNLWLLFNLTVFLFIIKCDIFYFFH